MSALNPCYVFIKPKHIGWQIIPSWLPGNKPSAIWIAAARAKLASDLTHLGVRFHRALVKPVAKIVKLPWRPERSRKARVLKAKSGRRVRRCLTMVQATSTA
jgi:hypothetical protein